MAANRIPKFRKGRVSRVRTELGLYLSQKFGSSKSYDKEQIDRGREELGFDSVSDALVAYTFFGSDLVPDFLEVSGLAELQAEIESALDGLVDDAGIGLFEEDII